VKLSASSIITSDYGLVGGLGLYSHSNNQHDENENGGDDS